MSEQEFNKVFSRNLRNQIDKLGITQQDFADKMNVSLSSVGFWLSGDKTPRMDKIDRMCALFHCRRTDLLEDPLMELAEETVERKEIDGLLENVLLKELLFAGGKAPEEAVRFAIMALEAASKNKEDKV